MESVSNNTVVALRKEVSQITSKTTKMLKECARHIGINNEKAKEIMAEIEILNAKKYDINSQIIELTINEPKGVSVIDILDAFVGHLTENNIKYVATV